MIISLDMTSGVPIYLQLRNEIVRGMGRGEIGIGERLPAVRQLAQDAGINTMTVNKAYQMLRREGIITIDRRHGAEARPAAQREAEACLKGIGREEFLALCRKTAESIHPYRAESKKSEESEAEKKKRKGGRRK